MGRVGRIGTLDAAARWLNRRGPDSQGHWQDEQGRCELMHFRLAIVDSDPRASQPMISPDGRVILVFNGEVYNHQALRQQLPDHDFRTDSDTEVILALYLADGVDGFRRLRGMFTLAIVDLHAEQLILHRDAIGKKPLYLLQDESGAAFSSSFMPLAAMLRRPVHSSSEVIAHFWSEAYVPPWLSMDAAIRPVMPGEMLVLDMKGQTVDHATIAPTPDRVHQGESIKGIHEAIDQLLDQAVDRRLQNNPQPVCLLSGGIDSTIVTERARRLSEVPITALTVGSLIPFTQDERHARFAARRLGIELTIVKPGREPLPEQISQAMADQDEPLGMPAHFLLHRLVRTARETGKILLSGDGGDEVFMGYRAPSEWVGESQPSDQDRFDVGPPLPDWYGSWATHVCKSTLLGHMFAKVDRASAEQGVEIRSPLLDWDLMAYVRSIPKALHLASDTPKHLLKAQLNHWPASFVHRRKLGFSYYLRWHWRLNRFKGLRESIEDEAIDTFADHLPDALHRPASQWSTTAMHRHFDSAWKLLAWSAFLRRVRQAQA